MGRKHIWFAQMACLFSLQAVVHRTNGNALHVIVTKLPPKMGRDSSLSKHSTPPFQHKLVTQRTPGDTQLWNALRVERQDACLESDRP